MSTNIEHQPFKENLPVSYLWAVQVIAGVLGRAIDSERWKHEGFENPENPNVDDILRIAKFEKIKAKRGVIDFDKIETYALPAILFDKSGTPFIIAKTTKEQALIMRHGQPPATETIEHIKDNSQNTIILMTTRENDFINETTFGLKWFYPVLFRFKKLFGEVLLISAILQLIMLIMPLAFQVIIDKVLVHKGLTTLDVVIFGLVALTLFEAIFGWLRTYLFSHTTSRVDTILGSKLFWHLLQLPVGYFESRPTGQTVARVRELDSLRQFITGSALTLIIDLTFTIPFFLVMWWLSPKLTIIVLASIPFYVLISFLITPTLRKRLDDKFKKSATNQSFLVESLTGIETLKAMAIEPQMKRRFEEQLAAFIETSFKVVTLGAVGSQSVSFINKIVSVMILWFGAHAVMSAEITIGTLVAFNMLSGQISSPILRIAQMWQEVQQARLSVARLGDIINTPTERQNTSTRQDLPAIKGDIRFEHVTFKYKIDGQEVLSDLNLHIRSGQVIGLVGRSGSGKSTLTKLMQRLHVPERGRIMIDGVDIAMIEPSWLRRQIGVVLQENILFARTVRENIALANPAMPLEQVIQIAKLAGAHEFILELQHGYDTMLEERGLNLSGGQRQRIAIARALATNPRILVFDEATSALDYESERIIQKNMRSICQGRTVFLVAHRLSTVRNADRILVLDKGRLIEDGSHDTLMKRNGLYAALVAASSGEEL